MDASAAAPTARPATRPAPPRAPVRVGSVSFLNAKPLIYGLDDSPDVDLHLDVPSRLLDGLRAGRFDVALLPAIDYQRMPGLRLLTAGGICCDGPTLTVRIFSPVPLDRIRALACDTDSHTSVALARVVLAERYGLRPEFMDLPNPGMKDEGGRMKAGPDRPLSVHPSPFTLHPSTGTALLLIGDKVIADEPADLPYQLDLGEAWKDWTGLPFTFAAWMARGGVDLGDLPARLDRAKREGLAAVDRIVARHAGPRGWPADVAKRYLTEYLQFDVTPRHLDAMRLFHQLAAKHGIVPAPPRELDVLGG